MDLNFVLCPSYHSATLWAVLLNQHPDVLSLGDMSPRRHDPQICYCGKRVNQCEFWLHIRNKIDQTGDFSECNDILLRTPRGLDKSLLKYRLMRLLWSDTFFLPYLAWSCLGVRAKEYVKLHLDFYRHALEYHNKAVYVDGSKNILKLLFLNKFRINAGYDINVIHLIRNPNGFCHSRKKYHSNFNIERSCEVWKHTHKQIEKLKTNFPHINYLQVKYEDFCMHPQERMETVLKFLKAAPRNVINQCSLENCHILGNKKVRDFDGNITLEQSWKNSFSKSESTSILELTLPYSKSYGYYESLN